MTYKRKRLQQELFACEVLFPLSGLNSIVFVALHCRSKLTTKVNSHPP